MFLDKASGTFKMLFFLFFPPHLIFSREGEGKFGTKVEAFKEIFEGAILD